jgi:exodeoxyribonuclease VII large subunit
VVPKKADLLRQLDERNQRLQRAGRSALVGPGHELEARRLSLQRLATEVTLRRTEQLGNLVRMLNQRDPKEVLRGRERGLAECRRRLDRALQTTTRRIESDHLRIGEARDRLKATVSRALRDCERGLENRQARLRALGPEQTLGRGYSICLDAGSGRVIRTAPEAERGQKVKVVLSAGGLQCRVEEVQP